MNVKNVFSVILLLIIFVGDVKSQEVNINVEALLYQHEPHISEHESWRLSGTAHLGLNYLDTLNNRWDYKFGIGYYLISEWNVSSEKNTISNRKGVFIRDLYRTRYVGLTIGAKYWFKNDRTGFYVITQLMPHMLFSSKLESLDYVESIDNVITTFFNSKEDYKSFNLLLVNGIGYKLHVIKGFSVHIALNAVVKFGNVVKGVDEGVRLSRGLTLGGGYRF